MPTARPDSAPSADAPADRPERKRTGSTAIGITVVLVVQLMLALDTTIVNVALPRIGSGLHFSPAGLSWVLNAYTLAFGGLLLLGGRLGDTFGRLRVFETGLALFTAASLAGGIADTPGLLIAARTAQGVGAALAAPGVLALLTTNAPDESARHRALALFSAVSIGGSTLGLVLGGLVTEYGTWRWTLFINVPLGLTVLALARRFVTETPRRPGRFDTVGAVAATGAAVAVVWTLTGAPDQGWTSPRTVAGFVISVVCAVVLVATERRVSVPLLPPVLFRARRRLGGLAVTALVFGSQMSIFFLVVQYLQRVLHFSPLRAGLAFVPMTLGIFVMSRITPRLLARFGQAPLLITGTLGLTVSYVWLAGVGTTDSYAAALLGPLLLNGVFAGLTFMPAASLVVGDVEPEHAGSASGLLQTTQQLGGAIGLAVIVSVYAAGAVPGAFVPGVRAAFLTAGALTVTACLTTALLLTTGRRPASASR
ncbi:MFS transporter [Streptomyces sp. ISL-12]|uniref:MFS transporter n=1 Tax=Streptomyces sp. ISL-12 TaxID=2819177 RepID=UPI001BE959C9|nr:MFS transporter [Streptomyces sp. ISL-12]MBT2414675.1 MFS transporter [Streptomyces sp. ISL-12]